MDVKSIVTQSLEKKKGVLSKIRKCNLDLERSLNGSVSLQAELRANVFVAIEDEDKVVENKEGLLPALLGSCSDRARQLHASPSGLVLHPEDQIEEGGSGYRKDELKWRNGNRDAHEEVMRALPALENLQLDRIVLEEYEERNK